MPESGEQMSLEERINRVINTEVFEEALERHHVDLFDFQIDWPAYMDFDHLPPAYQSVIEDAESLMHLEIKRNIFRLEAECHRLEERNAQLEAVRSNPETKATE